MAGKTAVKIIFAVLIPLFAIMGLSACAGENGGTEPGTAPEEEQTESADAGIPESQEEYIDLANDHYMKFRMWDHTDMGSGASNDDPYLERYWTVAYDPDTGVCTDIEEEEIYTLDEENGGYEYSAVLDREETLRSDVFADMDFVDVKVVNDGAGKSAGVVISYHEMDDPANRAALGNQGILCMQAEWCTTIDEAVETISSLHGEIEQANILGAEDARVYAKSVALKRGDITPGTNAVIECDHHTEDEYTIHAYEDLPDHTATIFWWTVSKDGSITDDVMGDTIL